MVIQEVTFIKSSPEYRQCPKDNLPEYAFLGRSNVGKSSLINYLAGNHKLAKTSNQPGRTRLINHFLVNQSWYLVDLPGYGYARLSKAEREKFIKLIQDYLQYRSSMTCLFLLIDSRHKPLENDLGFMRWLGLNNIPFAICFTKADKLSSSQLKKNSEYYKKVLLQEWEYLPPFFNTSTNNNQGREEILSFIERTNEKLPLMK